jgi:neutral ceramidase
MRDARSITAIVFGFVVGCGGGGGTATPDSGVVTTDQCTYQPLNPTANAGTAVTSSALMAGAAENILDIPVGTALGGYTARAQFLSDAPTVDTRKVAISGTFNPSIGFSAAPRVKAVALSAGGEQVVIVKADMIFVYEGMLYDLEQRLGPAFAGKVIITASHSHSAWAQMTAHGPLKLGAGQMRDLVYTRFLDAFEATARAAIAAERPAQIGFFADPNFDPTDQISRDRRGENDVLPGGKRKDDHLYLIRIDGTDNTPIAIIPVYGVHGTLEDENNPLATTDSVGAMERVMEEQFDSNVIVMHLQSAGADTSPVGHGGIDCDLHPGVTTDPCFPFGQEEGHGLAALPQIMAAWTAAGSAMQTSLELSMVTRSVETGPKAETFVVRGGSANYSPFPATQLTYAPFDSSRTPDGIIYDTDGTTLLTPLDEFNAPVGAALCEYAEPMFPSAAIDGTDGLLPYGSCLRLDIAGSILGPIFDVDFGVDATDPVCETTRTTISALRLGDYVLGTLPGETSVLLNDYMRQNSPVDALHTIVVGYAQGHVGYMLRPEDWMLGGYEPSVSFWGPLEAEYLANQLQALMPLTLMTSRQDGTAAGTTRVANVTPTDTFPIDDPAPNAGTIPTTVPPDVWQRTGHPAQVQPAAQVERVSGIATFVWIGDDPSTQTPRVTLEVQQGETYVPATRKSGRAVDDAELIVAYTPEPLQRGTGPQTHVWDVEWQAVPWMGDTGIDDLDSRGGLPLGNYRFHVVGKGWTLDSDPFQVVAGGVSATVTRTGGNIHIVASWSAPKGWRLMDMSMNSNQPVPIRSQAITVQLMSAGGTNLGSLVSTTSDANGNVVVTDNSSATSAVVTDRFGNSQTITLPAATARGK